MIKALWLSTSSMGLEPIKDSLQFAMKKLAFIGLEKSMGNETVAASLNHPEWYPAIYHYDEGKEAQHHYPGEVDFRIRRFVTEFTPDCVFYAGPAEGNCRPMTETFLWIKERAKLIAFICDGGCPGWHPAIKEYAEKNAFDLMVNGDANPDWPKRPQDFTTHGLIAPHYYRRPVRWEQRPIKFGAIIGLGSARRQKETYWLTANAGLELGLRSEKWGDYQAYADFMCKTKITVNYPEGGGEGKIFQLKYRVMEAGWAGCALFERENPITRSYLDPENDYFEYQEVEDLKAKLDSIPDAEFKRRAENLHYKVTTKLRPEPVWQKMLTTVGFETQLSELPYTVGRI